jgi:AraC-like DNA-binding protein
VQRDEADEPKPNPDAVDFLAKVEQRARSWIAGEWQERQRVARQAAAESWPEAVMTVHMRQVTLTVETLAPSLDGMSEHTLRRRLQQSGAAENPGEMIHRLRMEYAARLLKDGRYTIAAVADMSGFDDKRHFSARFREHFGSTPRNYRQK